MRLECECLDKAHDQKFAKMGMQFIMQFRAARETAAAKAHQTTHAVPTLTPSRRINRHCTA